MDVIQNCFQIIVKLPMIIIINARNPDIEPLGIKKIVMEKYIAYKSS